MAIVAENVRREYGDTVALDGVSLTVDDGEVYALIGPNGAGKTTLVRALLGTTDYEGRVDLFGGDPRTADPQRVGLLPQSFSPPERLTARELVDYYGGLYDDARPTDDVLADVGMTDDADTWYENLSGGQRRRTCVAIALVNDPDLLVLDEPTTAIDPAGRRALWELLESLVAGGTTVVLTTHSMPEAERLADRVGLLAGGELVAEGTPRELVEAYGGQSRLVVETEGGVADAAASAVEEAGYRVATTARGVVVRDAMPDDIGTIVDALAEADVSYHALRWERPDLESVYLALTGTGVTETGEAVEREEAAA
ncbi:ABC transporter ATP-binding protein [Halomarina oriensis]|uniref:ATP-binding cassette domain-containing protein n=1 Tax=Halomarina oriensis TaxID=671145 RepID=A0A6B0GFI2_9EURY|nr:ABC transporter ATP-binding protein [Halomarina oriensis]MWG33270.1 ATP-binding cassette domain-containing protein [Halomarina oriensis]